MNKLSAYLLGLILGGFLMTCIMMGHYDNWQSFGPVLGVILASVGIVLCAALCTE